MTREIIALAVSATNGCPYCINSHTAAVRKLGLDVETLGEVMAIVGLFNIDQRPGQRLSGRARRPAAAGLTRARRDRRTMLGPGDGRSDPTSLKRKRRSIYYLNTPPRELSRCLGQAV